MNYWFYGRGKQVEKLSGTIFLRAALLCISCDSPAMRKVAGFVGHSAIKGCYKCMKSFPTISFGEKPDYSGFDCDNWIPREHSVCHRIGMQHRHAKTAKERNNLERQYGVHYTALLTLPYYNAGIGRFPQKVESGFSNFKAEQWKTGFCFILLYVLNLF